MGCKLKEGHCKAIKFGYAHCDKKCPNYKEFTATTKDIEKNDREPEQAEWEMVLDDFEDGLGNRELPHCSKCGRGVYRHDAGPFCTFCGISMKNPLRT